MSQFQKILTGIMREKRGKSNYACPLSTHSQPKSSLTASCLWSLTNVAEEAKDARTRTPNSGIGMTIKASDQGCSDKIRIRAVENMHN